MNSLHTISVVIPAKDEQENISELIAEIFNAIQPFSSAEIIVVDDGSTDNTFTVAQTTAQTLNCQGQFIRHSQCMGQSSALKTGIQYAEGDCIVTIDGDGQNDPADIPILLERAFAQQATDFCVTGYRYQRRDTCWKRFQSRLANCVRSLLLKDGVADTGCGLKVFPKKTFEKLPWFNHAHRFIPALIKGVGGDIEVVKVNHRQRHHGKSKYNAWNRAWAGIIDLFGVAWLLHRTKVTTIAEWKQTKPN